MVLPLALALAVPSQDGAPPQQDLSKRLQTCVAISDSLLRLNCYDALAKTAVGPQAPTVAATGAGGEGAAGTWSVKESVDPLTDKPTLVASLKATENNGLLVLRCKGGETDIMVNVAKYLGSDDVLVTHRLDDEKPKKEKWSVSTDHRAAFAPKPFDFSARLAGAGRLVIQVAPYSSNPITSTFDLTGAGAIVARLRGICPSK